MYVVGVRNNKLHNHKIVFQSKVRAIAKFISILYKPLFNEVEVQDTKNIVVRDTR